MFWLWTSLLRWWDVCLRTTDDSPVINCCLPSLTKKIEFTRKRSDLVCCSCSFSKHIKQLAVLRILGFNDSFQETFVSSLTPKPPVENLEKDGELGGGWWTWVSLRSSPSRYLTDRYTEDSVTRPWSRTICFTKYGSTSKIQITSLVQPWCILYWENAFLK